MSTGIATMLALVLYALAFAPLILWKRPLAHAGVVGAFIGALALVLVASQTGIFHARGLASTDVADLVAVDTTAGRCREMLQMMREAGIVLGEPGAGELTVNADLWQQLPAPIHDAVTACVAPSDGSGEVQIIER